MQRPSPLEAPTTTVRDILALSCKGRCRHSVSAASGARNDWAVFALTRCGFLQGFQYHRRVCLDDELASPGHLVGRRRLLRPGEHHEAPGGAEFLWWEGEFDRLIMGVETQQERVIEHPLTARIAIGDAVTV